MVVELKPNGHKCLHLGLVEPSLEGHLGYPRALDLSPQVEGEVKRAAAHETQFPADKHPVNRA